MNISKFEAIQKAADLIRKDFKPGYPGPHYNLGTILELISDLAAECIWMAKELSELENGKHQ